jgi:hypothetical protein
MPIGKLPIKDEPRGFIPFGRVISTHEYEATAAVIMAGDMVALSPTGKVIVAVSGSTQLVGVAVARKATNVTTVLVYDAPDQQYTVQDDASGLTVLVTTHIGQNADILATASQTTLQKSQHELKRSDAYGSTASNLRILGLVSVTGANSLVRVVINEHAWAKKTTAAI